ncbi:hypothetical protein I316_02989 [Kwoniella heveanensis BCC8398]|uniref:RRM domain-containing protein n=1 Tax=Kwoniella heveanensis BCC8398 TaxID=1296120 RepID=A0A1B9GWM0_9TREE|nr:hypothetical protein I316_02989 [Kwoniella heveanensis BCC8398]
MSYSPHTPGSAASTQPVTPYTPLHLLPSHYDGVENEEEGKKLKVGFAAAQETAERMGRYLLISNVPRDTSDVQFRNVIQDIADFKALIVKHIKTKGYVIAVFFDPRQALALYQRLQDTAVPLSANETPVQLHCMKVEKNVVQSILGRTEGWDQLSSTSEAVIKVQIEGGVGVSVDAMTRCLSSIGEVQRLDPVGHEGRVFIAEFWDTRDAASAITLLNGQKAGHARLHVSYLYANTNGSRTTTGSSSYTLGSAAYILGGLPRNTSRAGSSAASSEIFGYTGSTTEGSMSSQLNTPASSNFRRIRSEQDVFGPRTPSSIYSPDRRSAASSTRYSSPHGRHKASTIGSQSEYETSSHMLALRRRLDEPGTVQGLANNADIEARARQQQGLGGHWNLGDRKMIPAHNRVFPERILSGLDLRTTVMIKDVPNKLSRQELVDILQEVVPGEFDFVYLRFDFQNCCNVGYAFVNFCSVKALYQFVQAKVGKKWNLFSSEKVLQVSYADIQGKAALINKFSSSGAMKGMPEPFPDSDNLAARQRSTVAQLSSYGGSSSYGYKDDQYYDYTSSPVEPTRGI